MRIQSGWTRSILAGGGCVTTLVSAQSRLSNGLLLGCEEATRELSLTSGRNHARNTLRAPQRKAEGERRAYSLLALHPDPPTVEFYELAAQSQAQPRALHLLRRCTHLAELLEDLLLILGAVPVPRILTGDFTKSSLGPSANAVPSPP